MNEATIEGMALLKVKLEGCYSEYYVKAYIRGFGESWYEDPIGMGMGYEHFLEPDYDTFEAKYPNEYDAFCLYDIDPNKHPIKEIIEVLDADLEEVA